MTLTSDERRRTPGNRLDRPIDVNSYDDLEFWSTTWRCPKMEIYIAVRDVGPMPKDVEHCLRQKGVIPR
jgi:Protein of unknown function (DUF3606)